MTVPAVVAIRTVFWSEGCVCLIVSLERLRDYAYIFREMLAWPTGTEINNDPTETTLTRKQCSGPRGAAGESGRFYRSHAISSLCPSLPCPPLFLAVVLVLGNFHTPWAGRPRSMTEDDWEGTRFGADRLWRAEGEVPMVRSVGGRSPSRELVAVWRTGERAVLCGFPTPCRRRGGRKYRSDDIPT